MFGFRVDLTKWYILKKKEYAGQLSHKGPEEHSRELQYD